MIHINTPIRATRGTSKDSNQHGFSLIELLVAMTVMLIIVGAVFSLVKDSMKLAMVSYELTDAQQNLRIAQEFINRDIMNAGDGLRGIGTIKVPDLFLTRYINRVSIVGGEMKIFTTDNNVPANTSITGAVPAQKILTGTDRQTVLGIDPDFNDGQPISLLPAAIGPPVRPASIDPTGKTVTIPNPALPATPLLMSMFKVGEIYFFSSSLGTGNGTFGTITAIDAPARTLTFDNGDAYGLNQTGAAGNITFISTAGTLSTSLLRMRMIQYYISDTKLLMRRVFGVGGAGDRISIIAEHVLDVQFNYSLITKNPATGVVTPSQTPILSTAAQQLAVREVEVKVTVETPHALQNGARQPMTMNATTSVRNMQFLNNQ